jgi:hypothetical protein
MSRHWPGVLFQPTQQHPPLPPSSQPQQGPGNAQPVLHKFALHQGHSLSNSLTQETLKASFASHRHLRRLIWVSCGQFLNRCAAARFAACGVPLFQNRRWRPDSSVRRTPSPNLALSPSPVLRRAAAQFRCHLPLPFPEQARRRGLYRGVRRPGHRFCL